MSPAAVGHEPAEDFASEAITTVTPPTPSAAPPPPTSPEPEPGLLSTAHGICVNCARPVTLQRVATDPAQHIYQWVPDDEPARRGRWCNEGSLLAYHWAADADAAVYHLST